MWTISQWLRVSKLCPVLIPFIFFELDVLSRGQRTLVINWGVASSLVWNRVSHVQGNGNKPSTEKLTCQEMIPGGLSQSLIATNDLERVPDILVKGLKQLLAFDALARKQIVPILVTVKAVSYSWAEIRSGIAEKWALHKIFEWLLPMYTSMEHEIHRMPASRVKIKHLLTRLHCILSAHIWEASCVWGTLKIVAPQGQ